MIKNKILIVDNSEKSRDLFQEAFYKKYEILLAMNGLEALDLIDLYNDDIAIAILDIDIPLLDGLGVLRDMKKTGSIDEIPVILMTNDPYDDRAMEAFSLGAMDLIEKQFNLGILQKRISNLVNLSMYKNSLESKLKIQEGLIEKQARKLRKFNLSLIDALSTVVEFRNLESDMHIKKTRTITYLLLYELSTEYQLNREDILAISSASSLHDIGKIAMPDHILLKPGVLNSEDYEVMKEHTTQGCKILEKMNFFNDRKYFKFCFEICKWHHERWDGKGYPDGLKGDEIPIWAQVAGLADVYDRLTTKRIYKIAFTHDEAMKKILNGECGSYNPKILNALISIQNEVKNIESYVESLEYTLLDYEFENSVSNDI